ncbi:MAG: four helix bundle protein [Patescibacteria group bacterium]
MKIQKFEDIIAWQKAIQLAEFVYTNFKSCKDFSFRDQIQRAVISISNNIAEGFERGTNKELKNFLFIAKGSCAEIRSMTYIARKLNYIDIKTAEEISKNATEISMMLSGFIKKIRETL